MVDFAVLADSRVKSEEIEKKDKHLDLTRKLKKKVEKKNKPWNIKVTFISNVIGALGTFIKRLV